MLTRFTYLRRRPRNLAAWVSPVADKQRPGSVKGNLIKRLSVPIRADRIVQIVPHKENSAGSINGLFIWLPNERAGHASFYY